MDDKVVPTVSRIELTAILHRLEAATSRLEDMAAAIDLPKLNGAAPTPAPTGPLPAPPTASRAAAETPKPILEVLPDSVEDFDAFINGTVKKFVNLSDELGGPVAEQVWRI
jgi:adenylyl cyclase-associated protein